MGKKGAASRIVQAVGGDGRRFTLGEIGGETVVGTDPAAHARCQRTRFPQSRAAHAELELADLLEVVDALLRHRGISPAEFERIRGEKRASP